MSQGPLAGLRVALVGPGRVGASVARWLVGRGAELGPVARAGAESLPRWAIAAGARPTPLAGVATADLDLLLLAVPDGALADVVATLAARPQARVALHVSGRLDADVLEPRRGAGSAVGGLHPLRAFSRRLPTLATARRTFFALQGDPAAVAMGRRLAAALGAPSAEVPGPMRPLYHLAATWAAGGTVTLLGAAIRLHAAAGVPAEAASGLRELARGAVDAVDPAHPAAAMTGPVARGESGYLGQLEMLREAFPALHPVAVVVALEALRQLAESGPLTPSQGALRSALREVCGQPGFLDPL
jgi:predicted short-subunit dehydrogenase-like oxidoreductase (DUF2520 family)